MGGIRPFQRRIERERGLLNAWQRRHQAVLAADKRREQARVAADTRRNLSEAAAGRIGRYQIPSTWERLLTFWRWMLGRLRRKALRCG